jgi:hypothetical protein
MSARHDHVSAHCGSCGQRLSPTFAHRLRVEFDDDRTLPRDTPAFEQLPPRIAIQLAAVDIDPFVAEIRDTRKDLAPAKLPRLHSFGVWAVTMVVAGIGLGTVVSQLI